jgi:hypothetical protein
MPLMLKGSPPPLPYMFTYCTPELGAVAGAAGAGEEVYSSSFGISRVIQLSPGHF